MTNSQRNVSFPVNSQIDPFDSSDLQVSPVRNPSIGNSSLISGNENSPEYQLKKLYHLLSRSFSREVSSVSDASAVIKAFVNKYLKTKDQLTAAQQQLDELNQTVQMTMDQTAMDEIDLEQGLANEEILKKKLRQYKRRVLDLEAKVSQQAAENEAAQTVIREHEYNQEEQARQLAKLENDLTTIKNSTMNIQQPITEDEIENTASLFEDIIARQSKEIADLVSQRETLISFIHQIDSSFKMAESHISDLNNKVAELQQTNASKDEKISELKEELPTLAASVEEAIPMELRATLPERTGAPSDYILEVIRTLSSNAAVAKAKCDNDNNNNSECDSAKCVPMDRYIAALSTLEDAMRFIQSLSNKSQNPTADSVPLGADTEVRTVLLTQCARIGKFIDENVLEIGLDNLPRTLSVFDAQSFCTPEAQLEEFLRFATEEDLRKPPVRELFAVFCAVCEANRSLLGYTERLQSQAKSVKRAGASNEVVKKLQRENFDLSQWKAVNAERIETAERALREVCGDEEASVDVMAKELSDRCRESEKAIASLEEAAAELHTLIENERKAAAEREEDLQKQLERAESDLAAQAEAHEAESKGLRESVEGLTRQAYAIKQELEEVRASLTGQLEDRTRRLKKATASQRETKSLLDKIQARTETLLGENKQLVDANAELQQTVDLQNEQLAALSSVEAKLRGSRDSMKKRLAQSEEANRALLEDIKAKNDGLREKYEKTIASLQQEAEDSRRFADEAAASIDGLNAEKAQLNAALTKLRVSERALKIKLDALTDRANADKAAADARASSYMVSLQAQAGRQIEELKRAIEDIRSHVIRILREDFKEEVPDTLELEEAFTQLERRLQLFTADRRVLADAKELRQQLGLAPSVTITEHVLELGRREAAHDRAAQNAGAETAAARLETQKVKQVAEANAKEAKEAGEWNRWARSMHRVVSDIASANAPPAEVRSVLEEALMMSVGNRGTLRRIDILRAEKRLLSAGMPEAEPSEPTVRGLITVIQFVSRLQAFSGVAPGPRFE